MVVVIIGGPVELAHLVLQIAGASTPEKTQGGARINLPAVAELFAHRSTRQEACASLKIYQFPASR